MLAALEVEAIRTVYIVVKYADQRKKMLEWWGDYVDRIMNESMVIVCVFASAA